MFIFRYEIEGEWKVDELRASGFVCAMNCAEAMERIESEYLYPPDKITLTLVNEDRLITDCEILDIFEEKGVLEFLISVKKEEKAKKLCTV